MVWVGRERSVECAGLSHQCRALNAEMERVGVADTSVRGYVSLVRLYFHFGDVDGHILALRPRAHDHQHTHFHRACTRI